MRHLTGIGGLFFRAKDPGLLAAWYARHLGIMPPGPDHDEIPFAEWEQREGQLAEVFLDFLKRADATTQRTAA